MVKHSPLVLIAFACIVTTQPAETTHGYSRLLRDERKQETTAVEEVQQSGIKVTVRFKHGERGHHEQQRRADSHRRRLDIILAHHSTDNLSLTKEIWSRILSIPKVKALNPYVIIYCQNHNTIDTEILQRELAHVLLNGEIVHLDNLGREGRVFLWHITNNFDNLAEHTLFSQDIPDDQAHLRIEELFLPDKSGMLGIGPSWPVDCNDNTWPLDHVDTTTHLQEMVYLMAKGQPCPDTGFFASYRGQFIVSADRIQRHELSLYHYLLSLMEAPQEHQIHNLHNFDEWKDPVNPWFGHVMERSWSVLFECSDINMWPSCEACTNKGYKGCNESDCQCLDTKEPHQDSQRSLRSL